jgi:hypothetical protein
MNKEIAFLDCNIWSVPLTNQPYIDHGFFLMEKIYYYNSLTSGINVYNPNCIQIPEFEIKDTHLLNAVNPILTYKFNIPILRNAEDSWKIDLTLYNQLLELISNGTILDNEYGKNNKL